MFIIVAWLLIAGINFWLFITTLNPVYGSTCTLVLGIVTILLAIYGQKRV